jgi:hypothetical protein
MTILQWSDLFSHNPDMLGGINSYPDTPISESDQGDGDAAIN